MSRKGSLADNNQRDGGRSSLCSRSRAGARPEASNATQDNCLIKLNGNRKRPSKVRALPPIRRPSISLVALCGLHVGVALESVEYLSSGAAIHDPKEGGARVRQPDVEPSNKLQLVPSSDFLLGAVRLRGTKDCNDLSRLCRCRTWAHRQVHLVLCGYEAPNPNQQRDYRKRWALHGLLDLEPSTTCWTR